MSVRLSLAWSFAGQLYAMAVLFVGTVIVARLLSPAEMGVYALGFAVYSVFTILTTVGINSWVVREAEMDEDALASAFALNATLFALLSAAIFLGSFPLTRLLDSEGAGEVLRILAIRPLLGIVEFRPSAMMQRTLQFKRIATVQILSATVTGLVMIGLAIAGWSYLSLAIGIVAGAMVSSVAYALVGRQFVSLRTSREHWRKIVEFAVRILSISGLAIAAQRISEVIMGRLLGLGALGIYTRATQIWDMIYFSLYGAIARVLFAQLSRSYAETGTAGPAYLRSLECVTAVFWPLAAGLAFLAGPAINLVFGEQYLDAARPLALLMIALALACAFAMNWEMFVIHKETDRQTRFEAIRAITMVVAFTAGCVFGIEWAAVGRIAECLVGLLLYLPWLASMAGVKKRRFLNIYAQSGLLALVASLPSAACMAYFGFSPQAPLGWVAASVALGIVGWLACLHIVKHPLDEEIKRLWDLPRAYFGMAK